jgi:hypothetical protein
MKLVTRIEVEGASEATSLRVEGLTWLLGHVVIKQQMDIGKAPQFGCCR